MPVVTNSGSNREPSVSGIHKRSVSAGNNRIGTTASENDMALKNNGNTIQKDSFEDSTNDEDIKQEPTMSSLPSYPLLDTFSLLCILMVFPLWLSTITLILYVFLGHPDFWDTILSFFLRQKLNKITPSTAVISAKKSKKFLVFSFILYLTLDAVFMSLFFYFSPSLVPFIIILSKAFIASNLTSLRNRYILDAFLSSVLLVVLENSALYAIKYYNIFRGDSLLSISSSFASTDFLYPLYYNTPTSVTKTLLFHLTFHKVHQDSSLMFQMEFALQFFHSTLSLFIILHNLSFVLRKITFINMLYENLESFAFFHSTDNTDNSDNNLNALLQNNIKKPKYQNTFHIPKEIACSTLPIVNLYPLDDEDEDLQIDQDPNLEPANEDSQDQEDGLNGNLTLNNLTNEGSIPMWFPDDQKVSNIKDISSKSYVVAQNFETFCKMIWSSTSNLISLHKSDSTKNIFNNQFSESNPLSQNIAYSPLTSNNSKQKNSNITGNSPKKAVLKFKNNSALDKKGKLNILKYQQPLWTFLNAIRTMFSRQDHYSGTYASQNAMVPTSSGVNDYERHNNSSPQCFVWFTGEKSIAFELHGIGLEQLLVKVNNVIWESIVSCNYYGCELLVIDGLSPLCQYDVDFVKIKLNGELSLLTSITVSTTYQDKTVTQNTVSSPLRTLQQSIIFTQQVIEREKAIIKKIKGDWKKKSMQIKNEIDSLNNRSNLSDESRNYKKLDSLRQMVVKSNTEIDNLSKKLEEVRLSQAKIEEMYLNVKRLYENESRVFNKYIEEIRKSAEYEEKKIKALRSEKNQLLVKKDKIVSKKLRIHHDVEILGNELETLKKTEISLRVEKRKIRSIQREEKYKLLVKDIKNYEQQLKSKSMTLT
jgi:hypothetical protein